MATEKRMIYANEAEKELIEAIKHINLYGSDWVNGYCEGIAAAHSIIQSMPAVDAAEVVADPNIMELCFKNGERHMKEKVCRELTRIAEHMPCITLAQAIQLLEGL
jgi:hypothetical protein